MSECSVTSCTNVNGHRRVRIAIVCAPAFGELGGLWTLQQPAASKGSDSTLSFCSTSATIAPAFFKQKHKIL
jgi:hypothetical protein